MDKFANLSRVGDSLKGDGVLRRLHELPRTELFSPWNVEGGPSMQSMRNARLTRGRNLHNGQAFVILDNNFKRSPWKKERLPFEWIGETLFLER